MNRASGLRVQVLLAGTLLCGCAKEVDWRDQIHGHPEVLQALPAGVKLVEQSGEGANKEAGIAEVRIRFPASVDELTWLSSLRTTLQGSGQRTDVAPGRVDLFNPPLSIIYREDSDEVLLVTESK